MAVRDSVVFDEYQMAKSLLVAIPQIEQAYAESSPNGLSVLIVVPDKNEDVQNKIFEAEAELIDAFPSLAVDFDVVFRWRVGCSAPSCPDILGSCSVIPFQSSSSAAVRAAV